MVNAELTTFKQSDFFEHHALMVHDLSLETLLIVVPNQSFYLVAEVRINEEVAQAFETGQQFSRAEPPSTSPLVHCLDVV